MALPKVKFTISDNGLGRTGEPVQKVPGLVVTGSTVVDGITVGTPVQIFSLAQAEELGITEADNAFAHRHVKDFYAVAGQGAELWVLVISDATTLTDAADVNNDIIKKLVNVADGALKIVGIVRKSPGGETITEGLDEDFHTAVPKVQELAEYFADRYKPFRAIVGGNSYSGTPADLKDFEQGTFPRVLPWISGNTNDPEPAVGLLLGRYASIPVQRSAARVKDGPITLEQSYLTDGSTVEESADELEAIHAKGYNFLRTFSGRLGYFVSDDRTAVTSANDFALLPRGLVMDKAVLIAYDSMVEELSDDIPIDGATGKIHPALIKGWQRKIERRIEQEMIALGELSAVSARIDPDQDVLSTDKVEVRVSLVPVGYAKTIEVLIGFTTQIEE